MTTKEKQEQILNVVKNDGYLGLQHQEYLRMSFLALAEDLAEKKMMH